MLDVLDSEILITEPRLHRVSSLEPIEWEAGPQPWPVRPAARSLHSELVLVDDKQRRRAAVPIAWDQRAAHGSSVSLHGGDASGTLRLSLATTPPEGTHLHFAFEPSKQASPSALSTILSWFEQYHSSRLVGLWDSDRGEWLLDPVEVATPAPVIPAGYADVVKAMARIERRAAVDLAVPHALDDNVAHQVEIADQLLRGLTVTGTWKTAALNDDAHMRRLLSTAGFGVKLQFVRDYEMQLLGRSIHLGAVQHTFEQAHVATSDAGTGPIPLVAGTHNGMHLRLVSVPERLNADGSTSWMPAAMLEEHRGRWVAQSGTSIILRGASYSEVAAGARAGGRLATVWRVPDSGDDAGGRLRTPA